MKFSAAVIDTNVVVAGLLTRESESPTATILDGMCRGSFAFLLSTALVAEYREVLLRRKIRALHGLSEREVDDLLTALVTHAMMREPAARRGAPDPDDDHLWSLVLAEAGSVLVTGDRALARKPPPGTAVITPRDFIALLR